MVQFRSIQQHDLKSVFLLLQQLTEIDYSTRNIQGCWDNFTQNTSSNSIVGLLNDKIVAYGSIVIENKIRGELAGHIEDIVVCKSIRNKGIGIELINELIKIGRNKGCYRVTLLCDDNLSSFYEKNGFVKNGIAMKKMYI
jgi:glucosamine-phosphate N-acetyltransferase